MCILGYFAAVLLAIIVVGLIVLGLGSIRDIHRYLEIRNVTAVLTVRVLVIRLNLQSDAHCDHFR